MGDLARWPKGDVEEVYTDGNGPWVWKWLWVSWSFHEGLATQLTTLSGRQFRPEVAIRRLGWVVEQSSKVAWGFQLEQSAANPQERKGRSRETHTFLYPFNFSGSGAPSERYTMIGANPTKVAAKKRKRRHMQRLRRTFRGVIKRGSISPS